MVNKASKNNHFILQIISIIPTWKQARSESEADKKTKCSVQVLWAFLTSPSNLAAIQQI